MSGGGDCPLCGYRLDGPTCLRCEVAAKMEATARAARREKSAKGWANRPMICVDTSEPVETAYDFSAYGALQGRVNLYTADYSLESYEDLIVVERKTCSDAYGSMSSGRERFEDCLQRMGDIINKPDGYAAIVIEADFSEFVRGPETSMMDRGACVNSYLAWSVRGRLPVFFAANRRMGIAVTEAILRHWYDQHVARPEKESVKARKAKAPSSP